ncbi:hypothetical protein ACLX1H_006017 [Fusarium chlamydosporum]
MVLNYERAGYGKSETAPSDGSRSASALAMELHLLLRVAKITPPYIMICHHRSIEILREFMGLRNLAQFKGFVFVDAKTSPVNPPPEAIQSKLEELMLCYGDCHRLGDSAWQALLDEEARVGHKAAAKQEVVEYRATSVTTGSSAEHPEYGRVPLMILEADRAFDLKKIYGEAVQSDIGSEDQRDQMKRLLEGTNKWDDQKSLVQLSERSKYQYLAGVGRKIQLVAPEKIADAVAWILMQYRC